MPGDSRYEQSDVVKDIDGVLATESNLLLSHWLEDGELDKNGKPYTKETIFSERIPNEFIKTRSTVLGGLMDGLSPLGKINASQKLHEGSGLSDYFWSTPVEAISKTLFARPNLIFEDVHRVLEPGETGIIKCVITPSWILCTHFHLFLVYNEMSDPDLENWNTEDLRIFRDQQQHFYESQFLKYIRDESEKDQGFLSTFVECCTGSSCLPYVPTGSDSFKILVEFNLNIDVM